MNTGKYRGILTTGKDDRGFGFIKPDTGTREVFLHISALKPAGRRPRVGDTIYYELTTQADGKLRASKASIEGVTSRPAPKKLKTQSYRLMPMVSIVAVIAIISIFIGEFSDSRSPSPITSTITKSGCRIKGNISVETGNKVYHVPGAEDYESTVIDPSKGEKWFCTESEAIADGWRKAPR